ncbi:CarD family transcriptional regulator, partial [Candidatus Venteria ishoeyi]|uniref:CarD family transcriptional regulator n=1 Tax=Candidatus Venteria ishoeyi TaxID=1899563 RepID=UPI000A669407
QIKNKESKRLHIKGLVGSSSSFIISTILQQSERHILLLHKDKEEAAYAHNDLCNILNNEKQALFYPSSYKSKIHNDRLDTASIVLRTEVLNQLSNSTEKRILVSYPGAITEKVLSREKLDKNTLKLKVGEEIGIDFITEILDDYHFERSDFVFDPGHYSIRGSIVDIFSFSNDVPYRIDFFGDEVESIRSFDIESQLSLEHYDEISIVPNIQDDRISSKKYSLFDFLPDDTLIISNDLTFFKARVDRLVNDAKQKYVEDESGERGIHPEEFLLSSTDIIKQLENYQIIELGSQTWFTAKHEIKFNISPQPVFNKDFELLSNNMFENYSNGFINVLFSSSQKQVDRLQSIFKEINKEVEEFSPILKAIHEGFVEHDLSLCCYTDHQIFERYHKFQIKSRIVKKESITIRELTGLHPGDYVVHADHGIGKFAGLTRV